MTQSGGNMTAPLYDVKARFSEYVTMAEQGEVVMITKHGKASVVMISVENLSELDKKNTDSFSSRYKKWRTSFDENEMDDEYSNILSDIRKSSAATVKNPFDVE